MSGMDAAERAAGLDRMRVYLAVLQPPMRLMQWDIRVADESPDGTECNADCSRRYRQWEARIRFSDAGLAGSPEEVRITCVHELLHCVSTGDYNAAREAIDGLDAIAQVWAQERLDNEYERTTDHLARIIAPFLPLPPVVSES